jgi:DNA-binding transcriptional ArsR family regulator/uncharacterized protein YndB with AHSA1/START domain
MNLSSDQLSATFAALADPTRRAILHHLSQSGEVSVGDLAEPFAMTLPAITKHLKVLENAGLITRSRDAQWRPCRLAPQPLQEVSSYLEQYRKFWEGSFDGLEGYLKDLQAEMNLQEPKATPTPRPKAVIEESTFIIARTFNFPRDKFWKVLTDSQHCPFWLGPPGFTMPLARGDFRPDGDFHYCLQSPQGHQIWGKWTYLEIQPPRWQSFLQSFSDETGQIVRNPMTKNWPLRSLTTNKLVSKGSKTHFTLTSTPYQASNLEKEAFLAGHETMRHGYSAMLDQLAKYLSQIKVS